MNPTHIGLQLLPCRSSVIIASVVVFSALALYNANFYESSASQQPLRRVIFLPNVNKSAAKFSLSSTSQTSMGMSTSLVSPVTRLSSMIPVNHHVSPCSSQTASSSRHKQANAVLNKYTKFVTFEWNSGRMGNQLRTLSWICAFAKLVDRAVVIPTTDVLTGRGGINFNVRIGLNPNNRGLFDVDTFREHVPVLFQDEIPDDHILRLNDSTRCNQVQNLNKANPMEIEDLYAALSRCDIVEMGGRFSTLPPYGSSAPRFLLDKLDLFHTFKYLQPQQWIKELAVEYVRSATLSQPSVGMHFRDASRDGRMQLTHPAPYDYEKCKKNTRNAQRTLGWLANDTSLGETNISCTRDPSLINLAWQKYGIPFTTSSMVGHWLYASDQSGCFYNGSCPIRELLVSHHHAVFIPTTPPAKFAKELCVDEYTNDAYVAPLIDMWALVLVDFYFGVVGSSFDEAVCGWRGAERTRFSNTCTGYATSAPVAKVQVNMSSARDPRSPNTENF